MLPKMPRAYPWAQGATEQSSHALIATYTDAGLAFHSVWLSPTGRAHTVEFGRLSGLARYAGERPI